MELSIVFPAYNEEKRISKVLENYFSFFSSKLKNSFEIIIVPNNCKDKTFEISKEFSRDKENVFVENIPYYVGKGGAVMRGFEMARGNFVGFVDADKSTSPEEFLKIYVNSMGFHGAIGSRKIKGSKVVPKRVFSKRISSAFFSLVVKFLLDLKYKDTQCGAKVFRKDVAKFLSEKIHEKGWIFDIDILNVCKKNNLNIKEIPITWVDDEGSHISSIDGVKSILRLFRYRFSKYPK
ncbi:MAG: glycosyltransferase [Nanoarchaeota archaeon]|nr:glycosyltransferase [Nanoarchaeota archaeon]